MALDKKKLCHQLTVLKRIQETDDTVSLILEVPRTSDGKFNYRAGQFVTFFMDIQGEEIGRSYSLASAPEFDSNFKVTIKLVPGGKGSNYIMSSIRAGDQLWTTPPSGHFCLPSDIRGQRIAFYAAGSGITPIISLIKSALISDNSNECILFFQNRREKDIIFQNELLGLAEKFSPRFKINLFLSEPPAGWVGGIGRISKPHIQEFLRMHNLGIQTLHYICGPGGFMNVVDETLRALNYPGKNIIKESFSVAPKDSSVSSVPRPTPLVGPENQLHKNDSTAGALNNWSPDPDATPIGDKSAVSAPETIEAIIDGETHRVKYDQDETVLDCLLRAKLNAPYSCMDGACMACIAKVEAGVVFQKDLGILTDDNVEAKECLTCQAKPGSKSVRIHYESF